MTERKSVAIQVVKATAQPLPRWVGVAGLILVNIGTFGHAQIEASFGGGAFGVWAANAIPVLGAILSTLSHSLGGDGGKYAAD